MGKGGKRGWRLAASVLAVTVHIQAANAQAANAQNGVSGDGEASQGDIIVTAQRRSESLLSVPVAVSALSGDTLAQRQITSPTSLSSTVPNLQVNDQTGGRQPNFTLRGIGLGNEFTDNQLSPIGFYVDDAYVVSRGSQGGQFYDLARVEVLRGPQGTLYGRNTTGGAINVITRKPELSGATGYVQAGYGNFDDFRSQAAVEITPVEGVFGIRVAGDFARHDGYYDNLVPGQPDLQNGNALSGRIGLRFRPDEKLDINLRLFAQRSRGWQPASYTVGIGPNGINPITGYNRSALDYDQIASDTPRYNKITSKGAQLTVRYELSDQVAIQSLSYYDKAFLGLGQDVDGSPVNLVQTYFNSHAAAFNQELRLSYEGDRLKLQGGAFYGWDRIRVHNRYAALAFLEALGAPPDPNFQTGGATVDHRYTQIRRSKALFGQGNLKLTDALALTLGLRYTRDTGSYSSTAFLGGYHFEPIVQTVGQGGRPFASKGANQALTGRAALEYSLPGGGIAYASYSRGYRAGTFNGAAYFDDLQINYIEPERVNAYELGLKTRLFDGSTTLAAAAFYYDYSNQQLSEIRGAGAIFLENAGASTVQGLELEMTTRLASALTLRFSGGLLDSEYDRLTLQGINLRGNRLPFSPKLTLSAGFDWRLYEDGDWEVMLSPTVNTTSKTYFNPYNEPLQSDNGYAVLDASLNIAKGPWALSVWGRNLTGTKYLVSGQNLVGFGFQLLYQGAPRTFGVQLKRSF